MYYFGYGMNTSVFEMRSRCPGSIDLGKAILKDWKLVFNNHANVIQEPSQMVEGVLWDINDNHLKSLDMLEGYPVYYTREIVKVTKDSTEIDAWMYIMNDCETYNYPSPYYINTLQQGYAEHSLNLNQIDNALKICLLT